MAEELSILAGKQKKGEDDSYAWQLDYRAPVSEHLGYSVTYLNQGHFDQQEAHHRDGVAARLSARTGTADGRFTLDAEVGPWAYADTDMPRDGRPARDIHGLGMSYGLGATWHTGNHTLFKVRGDYTTTHGSFSSYSVTAGVGYEFGPKTKKAFESSPAGDGKNQLTVLAGETVVNQPGDARSLASSIEYRRQLSPSLDATASFISEGKNALTDRYGVSPELWLRKDLLDNRLSLGIGAGVYAGVDKKKGLDGHSSDAFAAGMVSLTGSYKLNQNLTLRGTWHRVVSSYNRDTDIAVIGLGYQF
jgi:hypothetical protein